MSLFVKKIIIQLIQCQILAFALGEKKKKV